MCLIFRSRAKAIEEAPPAVLEAGLPVSMWQQTGTSFQVTLRLHRPLYAAWEAPPKPSKDLCDLIPPRPPLPLPPPDSASDRFRAQVSLKLP
jgi:hypothetical protein